ncbi:MAG TPA: hypothetical protein HPP87_08530 [Planctomycetes bacterium]|nr:hypothetical protein [Planctomycetota bacterium]
MSGNKGCKLRTIIPSRITVYIAAVCVGCLSTVITKSALSADANSERSLDVGSVTIFLTGDVLGELKPCGCASGQLGGFEKRPSILEKVASEKRLVIDTGNFVADDAEQDIIKFGIVIQALSMLGYDIVNLTENDVRIAEELGLLENLSFDTITYALNENPEIPAGRTREIQIGDKCLFVTVATVSAETGKIFSLEELFGSKPNGHELNILIMNDCSDDVTQHIAETDIVDVVICPSSSDEPLVLDAGVEKPLLITTGRLGKYLGRLTVSINEDKGLQLDYSEVPVLEELPSDEGLVQLYREYQLMVKEEGLLEKVIKVPLPNGLQYLGSTSCGFGSSCHQYEYEKWSQKAHAKAYGTLVNVGSQYDPECIRCHVVGLEYETGFVSEKSHEDLRNVGCEVCHGPGSKHMMAVVTQGKDNQTSEPKSACVDCHTPEHSNYQGREAEYLEKIVHWKEPNQDEDVQK